MMHCMISLGALAATMCAGQEQATNNEVQKTTIEGKVTSLSTTQLTMTDKKGVQHSHLISPNVILTLDGKPAKVEQIAAGTKIRASITGAEKRVTAMEAIKKNRNFASYRFKGELINLALSRLIMRTEDGKTIEKKLDPEARLILDGKECKSDDLSPATKIRVTTQASDRDTVIVLEGIFNNKTFLPDCHSGKIVSIDGMSLVLTDDNGADPHTCIITPDAKITFGDKVWKFTDLKLGMKIRLTSHPDDDNTIIEIEGLDSK